MIGFLKFSGKDWIFVLVITPLALALWFFKDYPIQDWLPFEEFFPTFITYWSITEIMNFYAPAFVLSVGAGFILLLLYYILIGGRSRR